MEYFDQKKEPYRNILKVFPKKAKEQIFDPALINKDIHSFERDDFMFEFQTENTESKQINVLKHFNIKGNDNNILNLDKYLEKYKVLISKNFPNGHLGADMHTSIIKAPGISSLTEIMILLHEIGHLDQIEKMKETNPGKYKEIVEADILLEMYENNSYKIGKNKLKTIINTIYESERAAWSFALNKLRPLISKSGLFSKQSILSIIHNFFLQSYSFKFKGMMSDDPIVKLIMSEMANRFVRKIRKDGI